MMPNPADEFNEDVTDAALALVRRGWRVLPIKPGDKRPPMNSWQHAASTDERVVRNWFAGLYRAHGLGVATGPDSGLWVLDVDVAEGKNGDESLAELERAHGPLPATVETITGSGGRHIWFSWPTDGRLPRTTRDRLGSGLDVRGEGGQVLVPPTIHPNGQGYAWLIDHSPDDIELASAPDWLIDLVCDDPYEVIKPPAAASSEDSIAEWYSERTDWETTLKADGWTPHRPHGDEQYWTRPGKQAKDGHSATLHLPDGPFVIFSTDTTPDLHQVWARTVTGDGWAYSKFGYYAATRHSGDRSAAARALRDDRSPITIGELPDTPQAELDSLLLDWNAFWTKDHTMEEWLANPLIPAGRQVALYAIGGTGKSLLALAICAAIAHGRPCLGQPAQPPRHVLYFDYENTESDLMDRLPDLGYDGSEDWSYLHYALLPAIDPLDTAAGAKRVIDLAELVGAELVVIDTMARAVSGDENDADTYRDFYRWTGLGLKAAGRALLRLDHAGKELEKGQRGSSAKNDDVDVVWQMAKAESGYTLTLRKARMAWVPQTVNVTMVPGPPLDFTTGEAFLWPAGTKEVAELLDELEVPFGSSTRVAMEALKAAGKSRRRTIVVSAVRYRAEAAGRSVGLAGVVPIDHSQAHEVVPENRGTTPDEDSREPLGNHSDEMPSEQDGNHMGTTGNHSESPSGNQGGFPVGEPPGPRTGSGADEPDPSRIF